MPAKDENPLWIVVGTYDFHLKKIDDGWKVDKMKFKFKYQTGNLNLPAKAKENVKTK